MGRRTWVDEPLSDAGAALPVVDDAFVTDARERLARRLPMMAGADVRSTRAGLLDMTPDGLRSSGPAPVRACGSAAGGAAPVSRPRPW